MLVAWAVVSLGSSSSACGAGTVWAASSPKCGGDPAAGCCVPVERRVVLEEALAAERTRSARLRDRLSSVHTH